MSASTPAARLLDRATYPLLTLALLGPFFFMPRMVDEPFKIPAEALIVAVCWLLTLAVGVSRALAGKPFLGGAEGSWARRALIALVGWAFVASLIGLKPAASLAYFASFFAYMLGAQSVIGWLEEVPARRPWLFGLVAVVALLEATLGFTQFFKVPLDAWAALAPKNGLLEGWLTFTGLTVKSGTPVGTLGNRNYLAELMTLAVPVSLACALGVRGMAGRAFYWGVVGLGVLTILACGTRAAALGIVVGGIVASGLVFGPAALRPTTWGASGRGKIVAVLAAAFVLVGAALVGDRLVDKLNRPITTDLDSDSRIVNWKAAAGVWQDHPIAGVGPGMYKVANVQKLVEQNPAGLPATVSNSRFYQAHNEPLQSLAELGLIGGLLLLAALGLWLREVRRNASLPPVQRLALIWGVLGLLVAGGFGFPLHIPLTAFAFLLLVAAGLAGATGALPAADTEPATPVDVPVDAAYVSPDAVEPDPNPIPARQRQAYATAVAIVTAACGLLAWGHAMVPVYQASHYRWLGEQVDQKATKVIGADILFGLAATHDRFKAPHAFEAMKYMLGKRRFAEILALYDQNASEGLGMDALLVRAAALEQTGKKEEAIAAFKQVMAFYHPKHRNWRSARKRLKAMGQPVPPVPPRDPQPGETTLPSGSSSPNVSSPPSASPPPSPSASDVPAVKPDSGAGAPPKPKPSPSAK